MEKNNTIEELLKEYSFDNGLFTELSDRFLDIYPKWKSLNRADKTIMILYAEYNSYREVGKLLGFSHTSIARFINQIRIKLC